MAIEDELRIHTNRRVLLKGNVVILEMTCKDDYEAMLLADKLEYELKTRGVTLRFHLGKQA